MNDRPVCRCHGEPMYSAGSRGWRCGVKRRLAQYRYERSPKGRATQHRYDATPLRQLTKRLNKTFEIGG